MRTAGAPAARAASTSTGCAPASEMLGSHSSTSFTRVAEALARVNTTTRFAT